MKCNKQEDMWQISSENVNKKGKMAEKENYKYHKSKIKAMAIRLAGIL